MIRCEDAVRQLWEYLDGTVDDNDRAQIEEHLSRCMRCCGERDFAEELRRFLASQADQTIPGDVAERLNRTVEELGQ